jgi:hypothetical protein
MGLLDGFIAKAVGNALVKAKMTKPATLTKVTAGIRMPGALTAGTNPTEQSFAAQGLVADLQTLKIDGTLIEGVDRAIRLFGSTIASGAVPVPGDRIMIEGTTSIIVDKGVTRDAASASYLCQCRS